MSKDEGDGWVLLDSQENCLELSHTKTCTHLGTHKVGVDLEGGLSILCSELDMN